MLHVIINNRLMLHKKCVDMQEFVVDSILGGFDLNRPVHSEGFDEYVQPDNGPNNFVGGPSSATSALLLKRMGKTFDHNQLFHSLD